jgi:sugar phosphate isomerase/epimerase
MKIEQVAVTLFTVRDNCGTAVELAETARKIRAIGYRAIQHPWTCPVPANEVVEIMANEGLTICSSHEPSAMILDQPEKVAEKLLALGCRLTAYPYPHGIDFSDQSAILSFVRRLDKAGATLRAAGITLGYHNHEIEFLPFKGTTILNYLYSHTDPQHLVAELDTYWVQAGGGDCVEWCRNLAGRMPFIHLKDYMMTVERKSIWSEIGRGTLPFVRIIAEAERSGCEWFIVEQDTCPGDPFESLRLSFEHIKGNLIS